MRQHLQSILSVRTPSMALVRRVHLCSARTSKASLRSLRLAQDLRAAASMASRPALTAGMQRCAAIHPADVRTEYCVEQCDAREVSFAGASMARTWAAQHNRLHSSLQSDELHETWPSCNAHAVVKQSCHHASSSSGSRRGRAVVSAYKQVGKPQNRQRSVLVLSACISFKEWRWCALQKDLTSSTATYCTYHLPLNKH